MLEENLTDLTFKEWKLAIFSQYLKLHGLEICINLLTQKYNVQVYYKLSQTVTVTQDWFLHNFR